MTLFPTTFEWARRVNQQLDTDYHEIHAPARRGRAAAKARLSHGRTGDRYGDSSYLVSRAARETLTVMLSGMGGDEVFAGYPRQMAMRLAGAFDPVPQMLRRPVMKALAYALPGGCRVGLPRRLRNAKKFARQCSAGFSRIVILVTGLISRTRRRRGLLHGRDARGHPRPRCL